MLTQIKEKYKINDNAWNQLISCVELRTLKKKDHIIKFGTLADELFYIINGVLRIYQIASDGSELTMNFVTDGYFLMANMLPYNKSLTWVDALTNINYAYLKYEVVEKVSKKYNLLNKIQDEIVSGYIDRDHARELALRANDATERYIMFFDLYPDLIDRIPHYYIASYLNMSPIQLSRIRRKLSQ